LIGPVVNIVLCDNRRLEVLLWREIEGTRVVTALFVCTLMVLAFGCSKETPDFDRLRADLEKKLEGHRGNANKGNADIYRIVSLAMVSGVSGGNGGYSLEFRGAVECVRGFYMSSDGMYALSRPSWKAKRHVTKGTTFVFTGTADYIKSEKGWHVEQISTKMNPKYAPPM
jgi:hypothetical protein